VKDRSHDTEDEAGDALVEPGGQKMHTRADDDLLVEGEDSALKKQKVRESTKVSPKEKGEKVVSKKKRPRHCITPLG
jgi:hypothetical protein